MTKYKPEGYADAGAFNTLEDAIAAAKRSAGADGVSRVYAISLAATVVARTVTQYNVTYNNGASNEQC